MAIILLLSQQGWTQSVEQIVMAPPRPVLGFASPEGMLLWRLALPVDKAKFGSAAFAPTVILSSVMEGAGSTGAFAGMPVFDSSLVEVSETLVVWLTPGGTKIPMIKAESPEGKIKYSSQDLLFEMTVEGKAAKITSKHDPAFSLNYEGGHIEGAQSGADKLSWKRQKDAVAISMGNKILYRALIDPVTGKFSGLDVPGKESLGFEYQFVPLPHAGSSSATTVGAAVIPVLTSIIRKSEGSPLFLRSVTLETGSNAYQSLIHKGLTNDPFEIKWSASDGKLISDDVSTYRHEEYEITRVQRDGSSDTFVWDDKIKRSTLKVGGVQTIVDRLATPGEAFGAVKSIESTKDNTVLGKTRFYYDSAGALIRSNVGGEVFPVKPGATLQTTDAVKKASTQKSATGLVPWWVGP